MPVTNVVPNTEDLTLTITAQFAAPVQRLWDLYADPRQLEKVWGPPCYPATFVDHTLAAGTRSTYFMTSPEGEKLCGYWDITSVNEPSNLTYDDGFADENFTPNPDLPTSKNAYMFVEHDGGTQATYVSSYATAADLQKVLDMGVVEGATSAINQIDDALAS